MSTSSYPVSGPIDLQVRLGYGRLTVHADENVSEATVAITPRDPTSDHARRTVVEMRNSTLVVHSPKPRGTVFDFPIFGARFSEHDALDVEITVPARTTMKIASWGADVVVTGRAGTSDVSSGSTTITIDQVDGDLRLRYGSGPAQVQRVSGTVQVRSGSGTVTFGEVSGSIDVGCGSGALDVGSAGGRVRMRTGSGQASIGAAGGDVDLTSGSGGLSVGLRPGQPARLDVITGAGQLRTDLPIESDAPANTAHAITVKARTGSGDVHIFRAEPAVPDDAVA
ncbi:MAG TPA: DUF4097 family beta strand repeat-containing protein [Jatrophihabitantaceae bacterium]|jgi:DUF4097 and DUF4098 domain-containing protein YvlB